MEKSVSIDIDDAQDFEYFYFLMQQKNKEISLLNAIKQRIQFKKNQFNQTKNITLIGHSILDQWNVSKINNLEVNNLGISGISTQEYIQYIINEKLLTTVSPIVLIMSGTNDIIKSAWSNEMIANNIQKLVDYILNINSDVKIYFLEITPTAFRQDRNNIHIRELNDYLKSHLENVTWVNLYYQFLNQYGKLDLKYSYDGLHLNEQGYQLLTEILEKELS